MAVPNSQWFRLGARVRTSVSVTPYNEPTPGWERLGGTTGTVVRHLYAPGWLLVRHDCGTRGDYAPEELEPDESPFDVSAVLEENVHLRDALKHLMYVVTGSGSYTREDFLGGAHSFGISGLKEARALLLRLKEVDSSVADQRDAWLPPVSSGREMAGPGG